MCWCVSGPLGVYDPCVQVWRVGVEFLGACPGVVGGYILVLHEPTAGLTAVLVALVLLAVETMSLRHDGLLKPSFQHLLYN